MDTFHCRVILLAVVAQWKQNPSPTKLFMRRFVVTESWFLEQDSAIIFKRRQTSLQLRSPKHDGVDSVKSQKTYSFAWSDASAMAPFSPVSHECDPRSELPHRKRSRLLIRWLYTTQAWDPDLKEGGVSFPALFHRLWTQPEREPSLSGQPTSSSSQSGFLYPAAEWQEECREEKNKQKWSEYPFKKSHLCRSLSGTWCGPLDSEGEGRRGLSAPSLPLWSRFLFFFLLLLPFCFAVVFPQPAARILRRKSCSL